MTNKSSKEKIALLIKNARISKGYSQQQLADLVKLNLRSVQRIEKAEVLPRAYTLNLMAVQLDLDIALLKETEPVHEILEKKVAQQTKPALNKAQKLIVSITSGILGILLISAFLSQSTNFPGDKFRTIFTACGRCAYLWNHSLVDLAESLAFDNPYCFKRAASLIKISTLLRSFSFNLT